jgi:hypothetical protein
MGLFFGLVTGAAMFVLPAVRRLPLYKKLPFIGVAIYFWHNWGYNYGRDLVWVKNRNIIEGWERDMGIRNFQTGL